eukprot:471148_1
MELMEAFSILLTTFIPQLICNAQILTPNGADSTCLGNQNCTFNCIGDKNCYNISLTCPQYPYSCTVNCNGKDACNFANIIWASQPGLGALTCTGIGERTCNHLNYPIPNPNISTTITCDIDHGCQYSRMHCPQNSDCVIECTDKHSCEHTKIFCPISAKCNIKCDDNGINTNDGSTCKNVQIYGPQHFPLTIDYVYNDACYNATIHASNASLFTINDCGYGHNVCEGMTLYVPSNTIINGADSSFAGGPGAPMNIYAINGLLDLNIINYSGDYKQNVYTTIHCLTDYSASCTLQGLGANQFACDPNGDITCNAPVHVNPTTNPTTTFSSTIQSSITEFVLTNLSNINKSSESSQKDTVFILLITTIIIGFTVCLIVIVTVVIGVMCWLKRTKVKEENEDHDANKDGIQFDIQIGNQEITEEKSVEKTLDRIGSNESMYDNPNNEQITESGHLKTEEVPLDRIGSNESMYDNNKQITETKCQTSDNNYIIDGVSFVYDTSKKTERKVNKYVIEMDTNDVMNWLLELENGRYYKCKHKLLLGFNNEHVNGANIKDVNEQDLRHYGVNSLSDRKDLIKHIDSLVNSELYEPQLEGKINDTGDV